MIGFMRMTLLLPITVGAPWPTPLPALILSDKGIYLASLSGLFYSLLILVTKITEVVRRMLRHNATDAWETMQKVGWQCCSPKW